MNCHYCSHARSRSRLCVHFYERLTLGSGRLACVVDNTATLICATAQRTGRVGTAFWDIISCRPQTFRRTSASVFREFLSDWTALHPRRSTAWNRRCENLKRNVVTCELGHVTACRCTFVVFSISGNLLAGSNYILELVTHNCQINFMASPWEIVPSSCCCVIFGFLYR
jgi:hypothetical protein